MNKKNIWIVAAMLTVFVGISLVAAKPMLSNAGTFNVFRVSAMNNQSIPLKTAIENNDYATWKSLMEAQLTQENFDKIVSAHKAMQENFASGNFTHMTMKRMSMHPKSMKAQQPIPA